MIAKDPEEAPEGGEDPRLASLDERLRAAHHAEGRLTAPKVVRTVFAGKGVSQGNRVLSTLIGTPLGGLFVGWALDGLFGTRPWIMLAMLFLGIVAAFVQVWRISRERAE
jgi:ATP synthase protein I